MCHRRQCEEPESFWTWFMGVMMFGGRFLRFENNDETRLIRLWLETLLLLLEEFETIEGCGADMFSTAGWERTKERLRVRKDIGRSDNTATSSSQLLWERDKTQSRVKLTIPSLYILHSLKDNTCQWDLRTGSPIRIQPIFTMRGIDHHGNQPSSLTSSSSNSNFNLRRNRRANSTGGTAFGHHCVDDEILATALYFCRTSGIRQIFSWSFTPVPRHGYLPVTFAVCFLSWLERQLSMDTAHQLMPLHLPQFLWMSPS